MAKCKSYLFLFFLTGLFACRSRAQDLVIIENKSSEYSITVPEKPSALENKSAKVLQQYLLRVTGTELPIIKEGKRHEKPAIYVGETFYGNKAFPERLKNEGCLNAVFKKNLIIKGGSGKGLLYAVYSFIENDLGCHKYAVDAAFVPSMLRVAIPGDLYRNTVPAFEYRESYFPGSVNPEYLEWNKLQQFEDLWGLWGHSFDKLVPAKKWFATHPEYFALVKGQRQGSQLCLSNKDVFDLVVADLRKRMKEHPDAQYWSVSPNDDMGYCQCANCKAIDDQEGGPQGSLISFVNKVAKVFPDKTITTLAYGYTHRAPKNLKPADNVYVFLSDIDVTRESTIATCKSAAPFRKDLNDWSAKTGNIFVWDYLTQFTNYLAPFPNLPTLKANIKYFKEKGVKGIFAQGSGETYSDWAELKGYVEAKLLWDTGADVHQLTTQFMEQYYGKPASGLLAGYLDNIFDKMVASHRQLDIYGNPVNEYNSWLTPELMDNYSNLMDQAEAAAENNADNRARVNLCRLPLDYTFFQQAKFYGIEKHGIFIKNDNGSWVVRPHFEEHLNKFIAACKAAGVTELSEGGLSPDQYLTEWDSILVHGVIPSFAVGSKVTLKNPYAEDYPAKGNKTLTDGNPGYKDFSYNWLCFYGADLIATVELEKPILLSAVTMHFLDDPRHWIFLPDNITVESSTDGIEYKMVGTTTPTEADEHYNVTVTGFDIRNTSKKKEKVKWLKITARCPAQLPAWRNRDNKKPMIACDEFFVQ